MSDARPTLYYVYDPMCSWCWGYKPTWEQVSEELADKVDIHYVLGGLAADSNVAMSEEQQHQIASYWKKISDLLGTEFNHDFWTQNTPRRSTYPACRAALAARKQRAEKRMLAEIQSAYYLEAMNPSDDDVLIELASRLGLDVEQFIGQLKSPSLHEELLEEIEFARSIGGNSFPSLFLALNGRVIELPIEYQAGEQTIKLVGDMLAQSSE